MKKKTLLQFSMATMAVVFFFYLSSNAVNQNDPVKPGDSSCRYSEVVGYEGAKEVDKATAAIQARAFAEFAARQGNNIYGGVISKATLDSLFCGGEFNGLAYTLAMDPSGKHGPANAIFVIVGGVNIREQNGTPVIVAQSRNFYTNNTWCPPSCLSFE